MALDAAQTWGRPPWEINGGKPIIWYLRFEALREIQHEVERAKQQQAAQQAFLRGL